MLDTVYNKRSHPTDPSFETDSEEDNGEVSRRIRLQVNFFWYYNTDSQ